MKKIFLLLLSVVISTFNTYADSNFFFKGLEYSNGVLRSASQAFGDVVIPSKVFPWYTNTPDIVSIIGEGSFYNCKNVTSIVIPSTVSHISNNAFDGCTGLTSIQIPESVESMGKKVFYNCRSLTSIVLPSSLKALEFSTFENCINLTSVVLPKNLTYIGGSVF